MKTEEFFEFFPIYKEILSFLLLLLLFFFILNGFIFLKIRSKKVKIELHKIEKERKQKTIYKDLIICQNKGKRELILKGVVAKKITTLSESNTGAKNKSRITLKNVAK